ncbi:nucleoside triphosphate hydrolase protein [Wolfiporia cocos MD-104 SS10]|uniref:DNA 3'-5' helicase n=1 Tax=Wolfiporia cocos (strain MD-104) TaxID=742152 RepID=A0A2H3JKE1_WOLCO|nr:nucleoside triphosphate hydrolase protein [Wolfiporia cocos MD-104 SS10]
MYEDDIADLAHEYGIESDDFGDYPAAFSHAPGTAYEENIVDLIEQYEAESPSPPQRHGTHSAYGLNPGFTRHVGSQVPYEYEEMTGYRHDSWNNQAQPANAMHSYASAGPSTYRTPNFDRRPNALRSGNREPGYTIGADMYREIFKFEVFSAVQSACYDTVMHTDKNMVISAPTGSGKTVLFKLAIIRMLTQVHILNESRGSTLKVILSRMKIRGSSLRFIAVSATVPNIDDVASWLGDGTPDGSATIMQFGEDYRPCKLSKFVYGIPKKRDHNDFQYQKALDYRLYDILLQHSVNKPMLVFCSTRKGASASMKQVMKEYEEASGKQQALPWTRPARIDQTFRDQELEKLAACGIGVHHAGMNMDDRCATEDLYISEVLRIIFAISTLAVGVNLPVHTVIIKGVKIFQNGTTQEYSDLDIMQMMGRAGRPQFDKEGVAVILCKTELEAKYNALVQGRTVLESCLHLNLSDHINSEVGLGTITDLDSAKAWLQNSFMFRRIQKNPNYYAIEKDNNQMWQDRINEMVTQSIRELQETELVSFSNDTMGTLSSTDLRCFSSIYDNQRYAGSGLTRYDTELCQMGLILKLPERASVREILELLSSADEFSDIKIRGGEKQAFNKLQGHKDIRFQLKRVEKPADKAILGGINLHGTELKSGDNNPYADANLIFRHVSRIAKAVVEVAIVKKAGALLKSGLEVLRCVTSKAWEDRPVVLRQVEHIGEKSLKLLNRHPPFGYEVLAALRQFPQYVLKITEKRISTHTEKKAVEVDLSIECGLVLETESHLKTKTVENRFADMTTVLALTLDLGFIDFRRVPTKLLIEPKSFTLTIKLEKPIQSVVVYISSELMLEGVVDDPKYWDMTNDDDDMAVAISQPDISDAVDKPIKSDTAVTPHRQYIKASQWHTETFTTSYGAELGPKRLSNRKFEYNITLFLFPLAYRTRARPLQIGNSPFKAPLPSYLQTKRGGYDKVEPNEPLFYTTFSDKDKKNDQDLKQDNAA